MKALIVDDEALARDRMRRLLARYPVIKVIGEAENGREALKASAGLAPDVIFLDVEMPALDGLSVARALPSPGPRVVFVTAYDRFALQAFEAAAIDYLVKPVSEERLAATIERLQRVPATSVSIPFAPSGPQRVVAKAGAEYHVLDGTKITTITAQDHYSVIAAAGREVLCDEPLAALETRLGPGFVRVHRGAIVNLHAVDRLEREGERRYVLVIGGARIVVSRERLAAVKAALGIAD